MICFCHTWEREISRSHCVWLLWDTKICECRAQEWVDLLCVARGILSSRSPAYQGKRTGLFCDSVLSGAAPAMERKRGILWHVEYLVWNLLRSSSTVSFWLEEGINREIIHKSIRDHITNQRWGFYYFFYCFYSCYIFTYSLLCWWWTSHLARTFLPLERWHMFLICPWYLTF